MIQVIPKAEQHVLWTAKGKWGNVLGGSHDVFATDTWGSVGARVPIPIPGTLKNLTLFSGDVRAFTVAGTIFKNGVITGLQVFLASGVQEVSDPVHTVALVPGDDICLEYGAFFTFGAPGRHFGITTQFEGAAAIFGMHAPPGNPGVGNCYLGGALGNGIAQGFAAIPANGLPGSNSYSICAAAGTITTLCLKEMTAGNVGGGWIGYLRVAEVLQDGSGGTVNTATVLADGGGFAIGTFSLPIVTPQHVEFVVLRTGTPATFALGQVAVSCAVEPTVAGDFMLDGGNNNSTTINADIYEWVEGGQLITTEILAAAPVGVESFLIKGLYIEYTDPGGTKDFVLTLRETGGDTPATVTLTNGFSTGSIIGLSYALTPGGYITIQLHATNGGQLNGQFHWGIVASLLNPAANLLVLKFTDPSSPKAFDFTTTGGLVPATFTLHHGESQAYLDIAPGTYGVTETVPDGWLPPVVVVSNGDPPDAIAVADGETVTVTFTNALTCPGEIDAPRMDGLPYVPPEYEPCPGTGTRGAPRIGA